MQMLTVLWRWGTLYFQITECMNVLGRMNRTAEFPATPML